MNGPVAARRGFVAAALAFIAAPFTFFRRAPEPKRMYFVGQHSHYTDRFTARWPARPIVHRYPDWYTIVDDGTAISPIHGVSRSPK